MHLIQKSKINFVSTENQPDEPIVFIKIKNEKTVEKQYQL